MEKNNQGLFIVFEGLDRSGKSTQAKLLFEWLQSIGAKTELLSFPNRKTEIGKLIDSVLKGETKLSDEALHLLFSANRWEMQSEIKSKLEQGINLVVDRYSFSGIAYSTAKGLSYEWTKEADVGLIMPSFIFFLNVTPEEASRRKGYGAEIYEKVEFQTKVFDAFSKLAKEYSFIMIDGGKTTEKMFAEIKVRLLSQLAKTK